MGNPLLPPSGGPLRKGGSSLKWSIWSSRSML